ncbi:MAG: hypothetical protein IH631_07400, partial [Candidatus Thorarchaeota archaeon]|nr:hypothetical protein [Candidatus Thorarchaeota archaeon]
IEDFEELARKHGLDELLEDEEVMEEVRTYLKLRQALEDNPDSDLEQLAEEMEIDIDLAREWSRGESEPYSLKKLLNLEAFYLWDEVIRSYRELTLPRSRAELEVRLESNSELRTDRFFPLELDDALTWVEIMAMRRRGEIQKRIRNGREVYSRKQIMELSKTYGISAREIIQWLRGEKIAALIRKIGIKELKTQNQDATSLVEIIYRLYFVEGKTQQEVAEILDNKSTQPIRRIFREQGWTPRYSQSQVIPREKIDDESVRLLYFDKGLTLQGAATKLGTSLRVIRQIFLENGWTTRAGSRNHPKPDTFFEPITPQDEDDLERIVYVLYYNQNLSQRQIANTLGYNSIAPIR